MKYIIYLFISTTLFSYSQNDLPNYLLSNPKIEYKSNMENSTFHKPKVKYNSTQGLVSKRDYDALNYDISLDWTNPLSGDSSSGTNFRKWDGKVAIKILILNDGISKLEFDFRQLGLTKITDLFLNGKKPLNLGIVDTINDLLIYEYDKSFKKGDTTTIEIEYSYKSDLNYGGFFLYRKGRYGGKQGKDSLFTEEKIAYTMGEPEDARMWMPCNDRPYDKATSKISVKVPLGFNVASNGKMINHNVSSTYEVYTYQNKDVMPTYLMQATASKFVTLTEKYPRYSNPLDTVPITYFCWLKDIESDTSTFPLKAKKSFLIHKDLLTLFSKRFSEYPFDSYGCVAIYPFSYGGMEHQTMTSVNRTWLNTTNGYGFAHELAHHWFGDLVTCATWQDLWWNEGGATWCEAITAESWGGKAEYEKRVQSNFNNYLYNGGYSLPAVSNVAISNLFNGNGWPLIYQKSGAIYHMLRYMLGDSAFFPALSNVLIKNKFKSLTTDEIASAFELEIKESPVQMKTFFNQWVIKKGHPFYKTDATYVSDGMGGYNVNLNLKQMQRTMYKDSLIPSVFEMPIRYIFNKGSIKTDTLKVLNNKEDQNFTYHLSFLPDSAFIDWRFAICEQSFNSITSVEEKNIKADDIQIYPNPINSNIAYVDFVLTEPSNTTIKIYNQMGVEVKTLISERMEANNYKLSFNTSDLSEGQFYLEMLNKSNSKILIFGIVR
ncbi:MAG: M1 family aminopeptidase [Candidatus Kapabacteria bacterium]|nr:M1 family aminopeptidase [Candidatus Kapabacteria bacterium]